jgi:hypothetical protein
MFESARRETEMSVQQLWLAYLELGGNGTLAQLGSWLSGGTDPPRGDHNLVAQALNERYMDMRLASRVPYQEWPQ